MPNFPSIYLELQEIWKNLKSVQNQAGGLDDLETRVDTVESEIDTLQDKTQCISHTNDPTNSTVIGCDLTVNANTTLGREDESDIVTIKAIADAPTTTGYKVLTINDSTGVVKKETFASVVTAGGGGGSGLPAWSQQDYDLTLPFEGANYYVYNNLPNIGSHLTSYEQRWLSAEELLGWYVPEGTTNSFTIRNNLNEVVSNGYFEDIVCCFTRIGNNINLKYSYEVKKGNGEQEPYFINIGASLIAFHKLPYLNGGYKGQIDIGGATFYGHTIFADSAKVTFIQKIVAGEDSNFDPGYSTCSMLLDKNGILHKLTDDTIEEFYRISFEINYSFFYSTEVQDYYFQPNSYSPPY